MDGHGFSLKIFCNVTKLETNTWKVHRVRTASLTNIGVRRVIFSLAQHAQLAESESLPNVNILVYKFVEFHRSITDSRSHNITYI